MKRLNDLLGKTMALLVLAVALLALFLPASCLWVKTDWINPLLMAVMFGMGLTLRKTDFQMLVRRPADLLIGCLAQFTIMPLLAWGLGRLFGLEAGLLAGVILVGTCPGGTASNVITFLSRGDTALSVGMTGVNTLLAPLLTPLITYLLLHEHVSVDVPAMILSIVQVVLFPVALGCLINRFWGRYTRRVTEILPAVSVAAVALIVAAVVSHQAEQILRTGPVVFAVVILHNLLGYAAGFGAASLLRMPLDRKKALTVEVGMQNSGLATSLAKTAFVSMPMAAVPGAIFSVWHNLSGAVLAGILRHVEEKKK